MSDKSSVGELRKAAHHTCRNHLMGGKYCCHSDLCHSPTHEFIDTLADRLEEAERMLPDVGYAAALTERAEKAEREVERLTATIQFALVEWFEPHYGTNDVGMAALVRDRLRAALKGGDR